MSKLSLTNGQTNIVKKCSFSDLFSRSLKVALFVFIELLIDFSNMVNIISYFDYLLAKITLDTGIATNDRNEQYFSLNKKLNEGFNQMQLLLELHNTRSQNRTHPIFNSTLFGSIKNLTSYSNNRKNTRSSFWYCLNRLITIVLESNLIDFVFNLNFIFISVVLIRWYLIFSILKELSINILDHFRKESDVRFSFHRESSKQIKISPFKLTQVSLIISLFLRITFISINAAVSLIHQFIIGINIFLIF
jgi:hypothetical protein